MSNVVLVSHNENAANALETYQAFEVGGTRRLKKMLLYDAEKRLIGMPSYSYFVDGFSTNPKYLWLLYSTMAYCIKGRNLPGELLILFVEDRLKALHCFNKARYAPPAADAILIESITRHSLQEFVAQQAKGE